MKKDKLFFFGGYEYFHDLNSIPVNVPAAFVGPHRRPVSFRNRSKPSWQC